jgi:hypothetical protein
MHRRRYLQGQTQKVLRTVAFIEIVIIVLAVWTWVSLEAPGALGWSIRFGMLLLVASQGIGNLIIA